MPSIRNRSRRFQRGFSLIEVLVALAIAAGILTAFYQASAASMALKRGGIARAEMALAAEALLNRIGGDIPLQAGTTDGRDGKLLWRVQIAPLQTLSMINDQGRTETVPATALLRIAILLYRAGSKTPDYRLDSLRLDPGATE
jgi:general secretion pathway protein I